MKIALGAARGLAYLHEDSSPSVIHRDFKGSNILLEDDYSPKVSDFGLAKSATEGGKEHVSTRVMGTFGYAILSLQFLSQIRLCGEELDWAGRKFVNMACEPCLRPNRSASLFSLGKKFRTCSPLISLHISSRKVIRRSGCSLSW